MDTWKWPFTRPIVDVGCWRQCPLPTYHKSLLYLQTLKRTTTPRKRSRSVPSPNRFVPFSKRFVSFSKRFVPSPKRSVSFSKRFVPSKPLKSFRAKRSVKSVQWSFGSPLEYTCITINDHYQNGDRTRWTETHSLYSGINS